jgi:hypothetical protein
MDVNYNRMREEDRKPSKLSRFKRFIKENELEGAIMFGSGVLVGAAVVVSYPKFFFEIPKYNPDQPIPSIGLSEDQIRRDLLSGTMVSEYLKDRGLVQDLTAFATEWFGAVNAAGTDRDSIRKALDLGPGEYLDRLSQLKLEH